MSSPTPPLSSPSESSDISSPIIIQPQPQDMIIHSNNNNNGRRNVYGNYQINNNRNRNKKQQDYNNSGRNNKNNYFPPAVSLSNEYNNNNEVQQPPPIPISSTDTITTATRSNKDYSKPATERTIVGMSIKMRGGGRNRGGSYSSRGGGRQRFNDDDRIVEIHRKGSSDSYGNNNKY